MKEDHTQKKVKDHPMRATQIENAHLPGDYVLLELTDSDFVMLMYMNYVLFYTLYTAHSHIHTHVQAYIPTHPSIRLLFLSTRSFIYMHIETFSK